VEIADLGSQEKGSDSEPTEAGLWTDGVTQASLRLTPQRLLRKDPKTKKEYRDREHRPRPEETMSSGPPSVCGRRRNLRPSLIHGNPPAGIPE
jgi:hypothetical protein